MAPIPPRWQSDLADTELADLGAAFSVRQCLALPCVGCDLGSPEPGMGGRQGRRVAACCHTEFSD